MADIQCDDGRVRSIAWQKCRKQEARTYIQKYKTPRREGDEMEGEEEPPAQTEQAAPPQQEEQPQWPQEGDDTAAGPSSTQAPAAAEEAQQFVPQQHTDYSGGGDTVTGSTAPPLGQTSTSFEAYARATRYTQPTPYAGGYGGQSFAGEYGMSNTVPGPFGRPVSGSTAPPLAQEYVPSTQGMPSAQGVRYFQGPGYSQSTGYYQNTPYAGEYGGQSSAGEYGGGYDMSFPENMSYEGDMPFDEYYGGGEDPFPGMPMGGGGGRRAPSTGAAPVEARAEWVETRPENLYHSDETDGVVKDQAYTAFPPIWSQTRYSNL